MENSEHKNKYPPIGEELRRIAKAEKSGVRRFRIPLPLEKAYQLIGAYFEAEVEHRCRKCEFPEFTRDKIWQAAQILTSNSPRFGLIFTGQVGIGKTTLMKAINSAARRLVNEGVINPAHYGYQYNSDFGMEFYIAKDLAEIARKDRNKFEAIINKPMLAIEDLGEEPKTVLDYGTEVNPIVDIIEKRYDKQKFTGITTNLDPKEISDKYGIRVADRLREMLSIVIFGDHKSFR